MDSVMHFEVVFDNKDRAKKFYQKTFGWQFMDIPGMDEYTMITTAPSDDHGMSKEPGKINGGMMAKDKDANHPLLVITVDSIDATLKKVEAEGGKTVMPKVKTGDFGFYARFKDSEGNVMGLWQAVVK
ncbi:MAG: VOC family protein [Alphaproteobacteria bacterium]|nr:VOC family protein [Alphaproteobacteria bacterium]